MNSTHGRAHATIVVCDVKHIMCLASVYTYFKYKSWVVSCNKFMSDGNDKILEGEVEKGFRCFNTIFFSDIIELINNKDGALSKDDIAKLESVLQNNMNLFKNKILGYTDICHLIKSGVNDNMFNSILKDAEEEILTNVSFERFIINNINELLISLISAGLPHANVDGVNMCILRGDKDNTYDKLINMISNSTADNTNIKSIYQTELKSTLYNVDELIYISHNLKPIEPILQDVESKHNNLKTISIVIPVRYVKNATKLISVPEIVGLYYL